MEDRTSRTPHYLWTIIPLLLLVTLLGSQGLRQVIWTDELRSLYRAGDPVFGGALSPLQVWQRTTEVANQVPGYFMLLSAWGSFVGLSPATGRYLSLLLGLLATVFMYRMGRDLHSPLAGLGAAAVLGTSTLFVAHLNEMRMYTLLVLLTVITSWLYWQIMIQHRHQWLRQLSFACCIAGLLYTHYFSISLIAALGLYHLLFTPKNREWIRVTGLFILGGILFLPWMLLFSTASHAIIPAVRPDFLATITKNGIQVLSAFSNQNIALWLILSITAWILGGKHVWFATVLAALTAAFGLLLTWFFNRFLQRYIIEFMIPMSLLMGFGIAILNQKGFRPSLVLGAWLVVAIIFSLTPVPEDSFTKRLPWDALVSTLNGRTQAGDVVATAILVDIWDGGQGEIMDYYFHNIPATPVLIESLPIMTDADYLQRAQTAFKGANRIWESYPAADRPWRVGMLQDLITQSGFVSCGVAADTPSIFVQLYTHPTGHLTASFAPADGHGTVGVNVVEMFPRTEDKTLYLTYEWTIDQAIPPDTYSVGSYVIDNAGNIVKQVDYPLPHDAFACTSKAIPIDQLPPGHYQVQTRIYNWQTGDKMLNQASDVLVVGDFELGG